MTDHLVPEAVAGSVALADVLALWRDAQARGWQVEPDPATGGWSAHAPGRAAGIEFQPPDGISTGVVCAHDLERTMTWTGVAGPGEAVVHLRAFLGWPAPAAGCA